MAVSKLLKNNDFIYDLNWEIFDQGTSFDPSANAGSFGWKKNRLQGENKTNNKGNSIPVGVSFVDG